jgi:predicted nucleic acid-binding protein
LAKVERADLLFDLADEVVIPQAVKDEIAAGPADDPARLWLADQTSLQIVQAANPPAELLAWDLGAGETAVMAYAMANPGWTAVLDDGAARKCGRSFNIPVKGTLALVILAKQKGLINSAVDVLRQLQSYDFHIKDTIIREALARTVGENW